MNKKKITEILELLGKQYPQAGCALDYDSVFQLLIAVVLSAQTTDRSVNLATPVLFKAYPDAQSLAKADPADVESIIRHIGLYKTKAKNIIKLSAMLVSDFAGDVPRDMEKLMSFPGVGRKTANVVLAEGFGEQHIAVDTHVFRVSNRIGLVRESDVLSTEKALMRAIPNDSWTLAHHLLIFHGRGCCTARRPDCDTCIIKGLCEKRI